MSSVFAASSTPLRWWSAAQRSALAGELDAALGAWRRAWGLGEPGAALACEAAHEARLPADSAWEMLGTRGAAAGWLHLPVDAEARMAETLSGYAPHSAGRDLPVVTQALVRKCIEAGRAAAAGALGLDTSLPSASSPPAAGLAPWSGALAFALPGGWRVFLEAEAVEAWAAARGLRAKPSAPVKTSPLAPVGQAVSARTVRLTAHLQSCELDLASLVGLRAGDIVRLPHALDQPLTMTDEAGGSVCSAWLGQRGGKVAVELAQAGISAK